jgi:hypothetical protein
MVLSRCVKRTHHGATRGVDGRAVNDVIGGTMIDRAHHVAAQFVFRRDGSRTSVIVERKKHGEP